MSEIKARIMQDLKEAMKSGDTDRRDALRLLSASLKQVEVDERIELSDERVIQILKSAYKQREDALEAYTKAQRDDLAQKEKLELDIIASFLPQQLSDEELSEKIGEIITKVGAVGMKDLGKVMGASKELSNVASGKRISEMAKKMLG